LSAIGRVLTIRRHTASTNPRTEKYAINAGRLNNTNKSSIDRVGSGAIPKIAMSTAPPATRMVPITIQAENTSPNMNRAKKAFHIKDTAPRGARMTTGRDAIWNIEPRMLEDMKIAEMINQL
jgi:uncharacterized membrane protein